MPYVEDPGGLDGPAWKVNHPGPAAADRLIALIRELDGYADGVLSPDTSFVHDLGADSLDEVELLLWIADEFGVEIPDRDAEQIHTVGQLAEFLENALLSRPIKGTIP